MTKPSQRWLLAGAIALAMALRFIGLNGRLDDHNTWRQTDTAAIARNFLEEGAPSPAILWPRVDWGHEPGYVETEFQLYTYAVSLLYRVFGEDPILGRILSVAVTGVACFFFHRIARRFLEEWPALGATAVFALSPILFRYSRAFMPDATALLFYVIAAERYLAFLDTRNWRTILASAAAMALAILVKPTGIHLGLVLILITLPRGGLKTLFTPKLLAFAAISLLPSVAYYGHAAQLHFRYGNTFGVLSGGDPKWGGPSDWFGATFWSHIAVTEIRYVTGFSGMFLAALGLAAHRRPGWLLFLASWIGTIVLYYCITARYSGHNRGFQYHVYAVPPFALAIGGGLSVLLRTRGNLGPLLFAAFLAINCAEHVRRNFGTLREREEESLPLRHIGLELARVSAPEDRVVILSHDERLNEGFVDNSEEPNVFFHARRKGLALPADLQNAEELRKVIDACRARWFVNFHGLNHMASPSFEKEIASRMTPVASGEGFTIYSIRS